MRRLEHKLSGWKDAGLIDDATVRKIRDFERVDGMPLLVWAVMSLALLALALGMMLVVGANWDRIPAYVKLGVQFAAMLAAAIAVVDGRRHERVWQAEAALFLLAALVLAGIALQGQIYQQTAPLWQPMAFWTLLCAPALILLGRTWLAGSLLSLMLGALMLTLAMHGFEESRFLQASFAGTAGAIPFLMIAGAALLPQQDGVSPALSGFGHGYVLVLASLAHVAWSQHISPEDARAALQTLALQLASALIAVAAAGRLPEEERKLTRTIIGAGFIFAAAAFMTPHDAGWPWQLTGVVLFCAMWSLIVRSAANHGKLLLYRIGVAAIGARLIIVYFEVFGSLALTGLGLMAAGILVLLLLGIWQFARRRRIQAMGGQL